MFEEGTITVCQDFMNTSTMKYNKIALTKDVSKDQFIPYRRTLLHFSLQNLNPRTHLNARFTMMIPNHLQIN